MIKAQRDIIARDDNGGYPLELKEKSDQQIQEENALIAQREVQFCQSADENGNFPPLPEIKLTTNSNPQAEVLNERKIDEPTLSDKEEYKRFIESPENRENALSLASQILDIGGKNWFTVTRICVKTHMPREAVFQRLQMCKMFGFAEVKIGNFRDGKDNVRQSLWKITISKEDKIKAYDQIIQYHRDQIESFESQKRSLQ